MDFISELKWKKIKDEWPTERYIFVLGRCDLFDYVIAFAECHDDFYYPEDFDVNKLNFFRTHEKKITVPWTDNQAMFSIKDIEYWAEIPFIPYIPNQPVPDVDLAL